MEQRFLIDTNTLIDAQMNRLPEAGLSFLSEVINMDFTVSFITYIEFMGYKEISKASEELISLASIEEINTSIISNCISIRRSYKIKLPDAIIAATALANNYTLITNNEKDFSEINGLKLLNLHQL